MDPLLSSNRPTISGVDLKRTDLFIILFQNALGVGFGLVASIIIPHFLPGSAMRVIASAFAIHLMTTRRTLLPSPPYVRRFQLLLFFVSCSLWIRLLVLELEAADDAEHEAETNVEAPPSVMAVVTWVALGLAALHAALFPCRVDVELGMWLLYAGILTGLLFWHLPLSTLEVIRPLSSDLFRLQTGVYYAIVRSLRSFVFLSVAQTQAYCELSSGSLLELEEVQRIGLRSLEASVWTLAVPVMALPLAVLQIAITTSRRAGLWGERLDKLRLVWTVPDLPAVHSSVVSKTLDKFKNSLRRPKQEANVAPPAERRPLPSPSPTPSPPPPPRPREVVDWSDSETTSLLYSKFNPVEPAEYVCALGKFGTEARYNPHAQHTLAKLQSALNQR
jgi:hypothetical protein